MYGQWIRVEIWNWWARHWLKSDSLSTVNMDTVHWQWSIWPVAVFKPAKMNLIAMWFELKMKDSFRLRHWNEHMMIVMNMYKYISLHTGTIELDEKLKKKKKTPKHSALIYSEVWHIQLIIYQLIIYSRLDKVPLVWSAGWSERFNWK